MIPKIALGVAVNAELQLEGAEGDALRGDVQRAAEGEFAGRRLRASSAEMRADSGLLFCSERCARTRWRARPSKTSASARNSLTMRIRKMAGAAHHALLDVPRIRPHLEHFEIVIRFENQEIGFAQMLLHKLGQVAEIGDDRDFRAVRAESVADRIGGVVRNRERIDFDVADLESLARANVLDAIDVAFLPGFSGSPRTFSRFRDASAR